MPNWAVTFLVGGLFVLILAIAWPGMKWGYSHLRSWLPKWFEIAFENRPIVAVASAFAILGAIFTGIAIENKEDFAANLATTFLELAITIFAVDTIYRWQAKKERKREIIEQMGSPIHDAAGEAVRIAGNMGMLTDGSMRVANLASADLAEAPLDGADLTMANLKGANLEHARMVGANLEQARLEGASMIEANLAGANLEHAALQFTNLNEANLTRAHLEHAVLRFAVLKNAKLMGANLKNAALVGAYLQGAHLEHTVLVGAELRSAGLQRANLTFADLRGADLQGANLEHSRLLVANLENANLLGAAYDKETDWTDATYNRNTVWPDDVFDPIVKGCVLVKYPNESKGES